MDTRALGAAAAALLLGVTPAAATIYNVAGTVAGNWFFGGGNGDPFGVGANPTLSFHFTLDDSKIDGTAFSALSYTTGSKSWTDADIDTSNSFPIDASGFAIQFTDAGISDANGGPNQLILGNGPGNTTALIWDGANGLACNGCVSATFTPVSVPEPASWAMLILGLGALGWRLRRSAAYA